MPSYPSAPMDPGPVGPGPMASGTPPLSQPHYGISFVPAVKRAFAKFGQFDGRASRGEYWWFALMNVIVSLISFVPLIVGVVGASSENTALAAIGFVLFGVISLYFLVALIPGIAVSVRRLHDAGFSGWLYLLNFVGLSIVVLVLCFLETSPNGDQYNIR